jgi:hypothetical protein
MPRGECETCPYRTEIIEAKRFLARLRERTESKDREFIKMRNEEEEGQ